MGGNKREKGAKNGRKTRVFFLCPCGAEEKKSCEIGRNGRPLRFRENRRGPGIKNSEKKSLRSVCPAFFLSDQRWLCRKWHAIFGKAISARLSSPIFSPTAGPLRFQRNLRGRPFFRFACFSHVFFTRVFLRPINGAGKTTPPFMAREKKRGSPQQVEETRRERPNSSNLDVRLRHRWLGKKNLRHAPANPFMRFARRAVNRKERQDFIPSAPQGQKKKKRESEKTRPFSERKRTRRGKEFSLIPKELEKTS